MTKRKRPPTDRSGETHKVVCGVVTMYVTINRGKNGAPIELFIKANEGWQGWCDTLAVTTSLAVQYGCPMETILRHWRGQRFPPDGIAGQGTSLPDAVARALMDQPGEIEMHANAGAEVRRGAP